MSVVYLITNIAHVRRVVCSFAHTFFYMRLSRCRAGGKKRMAPRTSCVGFKKRKFDKNVLPWARRRRRHSRIYARYLRH